MDYQSHVMTLANSIIGVSVLAMPFCFKQCGILLSICMLLISSIISRLACHFLLKSAIIARRKTFEFLAFYIFGSLGKFAIEIGIIGFLLGTCIAFFIVMGDLGPEIISEVTGTLTTSTMRTSVLMALALFCVLPLGLLRNVDSLNGVSKATIGFYCCFVLKIMVEALPHLFNGDWFKNTILWRPAGLLQCLPIFSMALFCQTQLFEIYQVLPNATLEKMNNLVRIAVNICTGVYIFVGMFGYIAFSQRPFTGNILLSFSPSLITDVLKIGFVLSVAFSFPLVIFPCRASLYSLLFREAHSVHDGMGNYIPEGKFKALTFLIVFVSLIIGIMIPNIELILGLVGSTIGVMICVLFPVTCFICIYPKNTNERVLAQIMLFIGIIVMVLGTYKNLHTIENESVSATTAKIKEIIIKDVEIQNKFIMEKSTINTPILPEEQTKKEGILEQKEVRREPPQPEEPPETPAPIKKDSVINPTKLKNDSLLKQVENKVFTTVKSVEKDNFKKLVDAEVDTDMKSKNLTKQIVIESKPNDEVDIEAIKKEETELKMEESEKVKSANEALLDSIKQQNEVQKEIVKQQKKILEVIQKQENDNKNNINEVNKKQLEAVKQIEKIALKAIERIGLNDKKTIEESTIKLEKNNPETKIDEPKIQTDDKENQTLNNLKKVPPLPILISLNKTNVLNVGEKETLINKKTET